MNADQVTETMAISEFKATCLAVLERVRRTGQPVIVTKRGEPIAKVCPPVPSVPTGDWIGSLAGGATILEDIVSPAVDPEEWEANR